MSQQDPAANHKQLIALDLSTLATATTTNGNSIDTQGWRWATFTVVTGGTTTVDTITAAINGSAATGGTFLPVTGADFSDATLDVADAILVGRIDCKKLDETDERWLRIEVLTVGTTSFEITCICTLSEADDSAKQTVAYEFTI